MKSKLLTPVVAFFLLVGSNVYAQSNPDTDVKILPGTEAGLIKVFYARELNGPLEVKFLSGGKQLGMDRIEGSYPNGISKRYDVRHLKSDFQIEITSKELSVTYTIIPAKNWKTFQANLEKRTYNHDVVALR